MVANQPKAKTINSSDDTPKRIAIDARVINSSTGRYIERLLTYLEKLDSPHFFIVLVRAKDVTYWTPSKPNFSVEVADFHQYTVAEQTKFNAFLRDLHVDLVHFCMPQQPVSYSGNTVTTVHDLNLLRITQNDGMIWPMLKFKQLVFRWMLHKVVKKSTRIITPTNYTKSDLLLFHPINPDKIITTYEAADKLASKPKVVSGYKGKEFLLVVGRSEYYKNQRGAIEAHQLLLIKHPDLRLVLVGKRDDNNHSVEKWVQYNDYKNVDFFGFASDEELAWLYENCAAYVFPTFMEGFGLPPLEAMRHGAPVVSSNATCLPEVLGDGALYFNPHKPYEIAREVESILTDDKLRKSLIKKGSSQVEKYSWERMARQTLAIYNDTLGL